MVILKKKRKKGQEEGGNLQGRVQIQKLNSQQKHCSFF
jgi:hypothetical protein